MRTSRNYYEILGLPKTASNAQIKRRYRELVRKYHPDVARDKTTAHRLFIQINEAYEVLSDPSHRRSYDESLNREAEKRASQSQPSAASTTPTRGPASQPKPASQLLKDAQFAFIQRRFNEAANLCREVLRLNERDARAHAILGDIYRAQHKNNSAIKHYSYAMQYDPRDMETQKKLLNLMDKQTTVNLKREEVADPKRLLIINMVWWGVAFFLIMMIGIRPGEPIPWLRQYISMVASWSWNLVALMAAASAIIGGLLAANGLLRHPDDELVFENTGNWAVVPTGFILIIGSGLFFIGAALFYTGIGLIQGSLSKSVLTVFACVAGVVLLSALMYPGDKYQVLMFGGNVAFLSCIFGWYTGAAMKPLNAE